MKEDLNIKKNARDIGQREATDAKLAARILEIAFENEDLAPIRRKEARAALRRLFAAGVATDLAVIMATVFACSSLDGVRMGEELERIAQDLLLRKRQADRGKWKRPPPVWQRHAEELLAQIEAAGKHRTPPTIATEINSGWKIENVKAPEVDTLARWIRKLRNGKQPGPVRD